MKKAFLFALATLCVSAAQAVTVSWTNLGNTPGTLTIPNSIDVTQPETGSNFFSVALVMTVDSLPNDGYTYLACNVAGGKFELRHNADGLTRFTRGTYSTTGGAFTTEGKNILGLVFEFTRNSNNATVVMAKTYLNGTYTENLMFTMNTDNFNLVLSDTANASWGADIEGVYITQGVASAADFASVPEPTALALLALGVAGLALKRKVA